MDGALIEETISSQAESRAYSSFGRLGETPYASKLAHDL